MFTKSTDTQGANLGGVKSPGHKKRENLFINSFVGSAKGGVAYVKSSTRSTISQQGNISSGSSDSDIAIEGSGMLLVSNSADGEKVFTRRGDFQKDKNGYWKNGGGMLLQAWKLDDKGQLPSNSTLLSSLEAVNFANVKGTPVATTTVSLAMNLDGRETTAPIRGAGFTAAMKRTGLNQTTGTTNKNDIIFPEQLGNSGGITLGDSFTFTSTPPGIDKEFVYGGVAVSNLITPTNQIYGATSAAAAFRAGVGNPDLITPGAQLRINGETFTYVAAGANSTNKTFNSFSTLADAINKTASLTARIDANGTGRIYIAPKNPNDALTFLGLNGGENIPTKLGLFNIPNQAAGNRFYSLDALEKAVNAAGDASLKATIENGNIKITSKLATSAFRLVGNSFGKRDFTTVIRGGNDQFTRAGTVINSPAHGLKSGDLVRITGLGNAQTPDGIYAVGKVLGEAGKEDQFEIFAMSNAAVNVVHDGTLTGGLPAMAAPVTAVLGAPGSWQKIPGERFADVNILAAGAASGGAGPVTITSAAHGLVTNDVIYISGFGDKHVNNENVSVPDGYYSVTVVNNGSFTIVPSTSVVAAANPAFPVFVGGFNYKKVGATVGGTAFGANGVTTFNANLMVTTGGIGSNKVKLFTTSNMFYNENDYITFTGLPDAGVAVDGITVLNNVRYKVTANSTDGFVIFEVIGGVAAHGDGDVNIVNAGDKRTYLDAGGIKVNHISKTLKYLNIPQENIGALATEYGEVYVPGAADKSLAKLSENGVFNPGDVLLNEVDVFDSLGDSFVLQFRFAKLDQNKWAVTVGLKADEDGNFGAIGTRSDGQIAAGEILFDQYGNYINGTGISDVLSFTRDNGSAPSTITIDWANALNDKTSATITQYAGPNNIEPYQQNGRGSGTLLDNGLSVDEDGFIVGTFDNGEVVKLYQVPVAMFANINGLLEANDGTYRITNESGQAFLKAAGIGGAGNIVGRALEDSNTDSTDELLEVQDTANVIRANARVSAVKFNNIAAILSELKQ